MKRTPTRTDIVPVILGGDMASYPMAREFHEAYGVRSICVVPEPIKIIERSNFIDVHYVDDMGADQLKAALTSIANEHANQKIILMANSDPVVERLERISGELPANVLSALARHDLIERVSDKIEFARLCAEYGLHAPNSEVVHLGGSDAIAPTQISFPLIAKPAISSAEYFKLYAKGFQKVYFLHTQDELDKLWASLRAEHFSGDFLVQELIEGDDTYVDMITCYVNQQGKVTLYVSSQVLLEDHNPALYGNPVAMITRPMPDLWEKVAAMLQDLGWRGFANFDMKRDPKTGRVIFMDFNPRLGANSYYACVGGVNPMEALVADLVDGSEEVMRISRTGLYSRARAGLVRRYLTDSALRDEFDQIVRAKAVADPMRYRQDSLMARAIGLAMELNYDRKFKRFYPKPTDTSF